MNNDVKKRLEWVKLYESTFDARLVCKRCGISRPTLRKWIKRYKQSGIDGLNEQSRRPHTIMVKVTAEDEQRILDLRDKRKLGHRSIASEMKRLYERSLSTATIHKVLSKYNRPYLKLGGIIGKRSTVIIVPYLVIGCKWTYVRLLPGFINIPPLMIAAGLRS